MRDIHGRHQMADVRRIEGASEDPDTQGFRGILWHEGAV